MQGLDKYSKFVLNNEHNFSIYIKNDLETCRFIAKCNYYFIRTPACTFKMKFQWNKLTKVCTLVGKLYAYFQQLLKTGNTENKDILK